MTYQPSAVPWNGQEVDGENTSRLLIRDYPHRAIAIVSRSHALVFRHSSAVGNGGDTNNGGGGGGHSGTSRCMVEFMATSETMLSDYRPLTPRPIYGTLGLISVNQDVFLCVITQALRVATLRPGETVEMIVGVQFFCLNSNEYDDVLIVDPWDPDAVSDAASVYSQGLSRRDPLVEHPCQELMKLLSNRSFYYSTDFDLTNRLQDRSADASTFGIDNFDESFLWNSFMIQPLVQFRSGLQPHERDLLDSSHLLTSAVRGFCCTVTIPQSVAPLRTSQSGMPSYLTVVSRLSCRRAGTRFNSRGIDDDGNVANYVETETIYWSPAGVVFSYVQVRGSVPVFWEQAPGLIPGHQKISITRSPDGAQPAFDKHFSNLEQTYGAVHVINLLSEAKPGEAELSQCYRYGLQHSPLGQRGDKASSDRALLRATEYDFHAETKGPTGYEAAQEIRRLIENSADGFAYYLAMEVEDAAAVSRAKAKGRSSTPQRRFVVVLQQEGVFRTNCLDCLDRTNLIQTIISQMAVEAFLQHRGEACGSDFWVRHSNLWADNGDALSKIYAGTGALKSSFTRHGKMSLAGAIADARKSATRLYINNFADKGRQNTIDMLLGRIYGQTSVVLFDPISDYVAAELSKRAATFSSTETIKLWVGTFNLNGRIDGLNEDLLPWLCPDAAHDTAETLPEIVAVGFQEIVELSPQQIMNSDPTRRQQWETAVRRTLNRHAAAVGGEGYVLLRSGQLVGAALCIFVKSTALGKIKNVEGSVKKTGMSGMAGNKGAVAIRLDYASTPLCFVTAHLAAGFANYEERNRDYTTIHHGLRFQRNRGIDDHDAVIWFGDFNYRIGLGYERALDLVRAGDLESLYENDQLNLQMVAGLAFPYYSEARITFPPTYKFDVGRDDYDSSEKQRIPAWTDRVLRKGPNLRQTAYHSAPLRFSDHRPVYAHFLCTVSIVNEAVRDATSREIYTRRRAEIGRHMADALLAADDSDEGEGEGEDEDEDLIGYDAIAPGLPPASSDRHRWWLDHGKMAQAAVQPPASTVSNPATHMAVLNPNRPSNPFVPTDEPDWVAVPRTESRLSSFSSLSTSPYEHVNHSALLSSSAASQGSGGGGGGGGGGMALAMVTNRKLPPPPAHPHPSTLSGVSVLGGTTTAAAAAAAATPPPPPPPRRQTAAGGGVSDGGASTPPKNKHKTASSLSLPSLAMASATPPPATGSRLPTSGAGAVVRALDELRTSASSSPSTFASGSNSIRNQTIRSQGQSPSQSQSKSQPLPIRQASHRLGPASGAPPDAVAPPSGVRTLVPAPAAQPADRPKTPGPPPVAKKPAHLVASAVAAEPRPPKLPSRTPTVLGHGSPSAGNGSGYGTSSNSSRPRTQPPPQTLERHKNVDLLSGDDGGSELSRWQPLQPS